MAEHKNIHEAILGVMRDIGVIPETGQVGFGNRAYKYASDQDLINGVRPAMLDNDVYMYPLSVETQTPEEFTTSGGTVWIRVRAVYTYRFVHGPSETFVDVTVYAEGSDNGDKTAYKIDTGAQKYAIRQVFTLNVGGDDPDRMSSDEIAGAGQQQNRSNTRKPAQKKATEKPEAKQTKQSKPVQEPVKLDPEKLKKAESYAVPNGAPLAGTHLGEVAKDSEVGPIVLLWLAGMRPNPKGEMFNPVEDDKPLMGAARYIVDLSPDFEKTLAVFKENNPTIEI